LAKRLGSLALLAAISVSLIAVMPGIAAMLSAPYPPSWGGDAYGHLFKIWKLQNSGWHSWIRDWYSGYPFLRFYPPLSYLVGALFAKLSGSPQAGYKSVIVLDVMVAAAAMYVLLRTLYFSVEASFLGSVIYATSPWFYRIIAPEGNYPRAMGVAVAPLLVIAIVAGMRSQRVSAHLLGGLGAAIVLLSHHSVFATYLFASVFIVLAEYVAEYVAGKSIIRVLRGHIIGLSISITVFLVVSAFWLVPFIADHNLASFTSETSGYLFRFQSAKPSLILRQDPGGWGYYQGPVRLGLVLAALAAAIAAKKRALITRQALYLLLAVLLLILALGAYSPVPSLNKLPFFNMIPPYRWLDPLQLVYALSGAILIESLASIKVGKAGLNKLILVTILAAVMLAAIIDAEPQLRHWRGEHFDRALAAALMFIGGDRSQGWRFYQWGLGVTKGSMVGYSPVLAHKPCLDGWYRQGDPLYIMHGETAWALTHDANYARLLLHAFAVKYVVLDKDYRDASKAEQVLLEIGFTRLFQSGSIMVYGWDNASIVQPLTRRVLLIGCSPGAVEYMFPGIVRGHSCYLDDYDLKELLGYRAIILYDYRYRSITSWSRFLRYVSSGGVLVVDTYRSPDMLRGIPGTNIYSKIVKAKGRVELALWNGTRLSITLNYRGASWVATVYSGAGVKPLIRLGNRTVIGVAGYGRGEIYVIGLNLFYYAYLYRDNHIRTVLQEALAVIKKPAAKPQLALLDWKDGLIVFRYSANEALSLRVAEAWYPYWRVYIDGKDCNNCISRDKLGLIHLSLPPGDHVVRLVFRDPYVVLKWVSALAAIAALIAAIARPFSKAPMEF
jgi:uncharacterized membrane protein